MTRKHNNVKTVDKKVIHRQVKASSCDENHFCKFFIWRQSMVCSKCNRLCNLVWNGFIIFRYVYEMSVFYKRLENVPTLQCSSYSNQITQSLPRVTNTPNSQITNCFIHRIQLKTVKSLKVIWCLGCLSLLSVQEIILASELQEILVMRRASS